MIVLKYILLVICLCGLIYLLSWIQMKGWLFALNKHFINKFNNIKNKENEGQEKE